MQSGRKRREMIRSGPAHLGGEDGRGEGLHRLTGIIQTYSLESEVQSTFWVPPALGRRRQWHPTPSCLENPIDGGAWQAVVHGVAEGRTRLSDFTFDFSLSCIGEGNGNPLQCSCLENPRDGGAWLGCCLWGHTESDTTEVTQQQQQQPWDLAQRRQTQNQSLSISNKNAN